ncbi:hypothetical protein MTR_3g010960 [Medicago truncatula]|uniref:Uncharacterized protein n=1 Tax=Medicago truncatula TaxID=3880 RepID=G7IVP9_MEDTR|nr:hypothetical protein MTR_3g010960 [Medicago truncatula]
MVLILITIDNVKSLEADTSLPISSCESKIMGIEWFCFWCRIIKMFKFSLVFNCKEVSNEYETLKKETITRLWFNPSGLTRLYMVYIKCLENYINSLNGSV